MNKSLNIVHVDDDLGFLELVRERIEEAEEEHEIVSLRSYDELIDWLEKATAKPTVFIINLQMDADELSGINCINLLRSSKIAGSSFIVLMSESTRTDDVQQAYNAGANLYMHKRANVMRSSSAVDELLNLFQNGYLLQPSLSETRKERAEFDSVSIPERNYWSITEARNNFSELFDRALSEPQSIKARNGSELLVLDTSEALKIRAESGTLNDLEVPIRLVSQNVSSLIDQQKEVVRGKNSLSVHAREEALGALERLQRLVDEAENLPSDLEDGADNAISWATRFKAEFDSSFSRTFEAENLAKATIPAAIILGCGALGAMIAGPMGFGAGSVLGHLVTGQMKPGAAADKVTDIFDSDDTLE